MSTIEFKIQPTGDSEDMLLCETLATDWTDGTHSELLGRYVVGTITNADYIKFQIWRRSNENLVWRGESG